MTDIVVDQFDTNIRANSITVRGRVVPKPGQPLPAVVFSYVFSNNFEGQAVARGRVLLDSSGRFTKVIVDIDNGQSKIVFVTGGYVPSRIVSRKRRRCHFVYHGPPVASLYNRHGYFQQHITRTGKPNLLTVTLTWDDGASDINLHVFEPGGRHIYYGNKGGSGTPYFDYDNQQGYGPEHYIVDSDFQASPTGSLEGTYKIRVHYYADHGKIEGRSIRWTLRIEGATQDKSEKISGVLKTEQSWSEYYNVTVDAVHFIAIADRKLKNFALKFTNIYHYSAQLWKNIFVLVNKQTVEEVSALERSNPMATKKEGVELKREASLTGCSYKGWRLRKKLLQLNENNECWKVESVAISRIHYSDTGTRYIPVFKHTNWSIVKAKWMEMKSQAKTYPYAEQPGPITKYPHSIYCIDIDVNNSNTFIRWLFNKMSFDSEIEDGLHPGRKSPLPVPKRSFQGDIFCNGSQTTLTYGTKCGLVDKAVPRLTCLD